MLRLRSCANMNVSGDLALLPGLPPGPLQYSTVNVCTYTNFLKERRRAWSRPTESILKPTHSCMALGRA